MDDHTHLGLPPSMSSYLQRQAMTEGTQVVRMTVVMLSHSALPLLKCRSSSRELQQRQGLLEQGIQAWQIMDSAARAWLRQPKAVPPAERKVMQCQPDGFAYMAQQAQAMCTTSLEAGPSLVRAGCPALHVATGACTAPADWHRPSQLHPELTQWPPTTPGWATSSLHRSTPECPAWRS